MSSSFRIKKRFDDKKFYSFADSNRSLGGWEDVYVRPFNDCHPDFVAHEIGKAGGVKICVRKNDRKETPIENFDLQDGYYRFSPSMYEAMKIPYNRFNYVPYKCRRIQEFEYNIKNDLIRNEIRYNGSGIYALKTSHNTNTNDTIYPLYHEYSFDEIKNMKDEFDIHKLNQSYNYWKDRHPLK